VLLAAGAAYPAEYYLDGWVFAASGASGTASTENSFATMHAYRSGINNQIGTLNPPEGVFLLPGAGRRLSMSLTWGALTGPQLRPLKARQ